MVCVTAPGARAAKAAPASPLRGFACVWLSLRAFEVLRGTRAHVVLQAAVARCEMTSLIGGRNGNGRRCAKNCILNFIRIPCWQGCRFEHVKLRPLLQMMIVWERVKEQETDAE